MGTFINKEKVPAVLFSKDCALITVSISTLSWWLQQQTQTTQGAFISTRVQGNGRWASAFFRSKTLYWYILSQHTIDQNNWAKNVIWLLAHLCCADFMQKIADASEILHLGQGQEWRRLDKSRGDLTRGHVAAILVSPGENVIELRLAPTSRNHQHHPLYSPQSPVYLLELETNLRQVTLHTVGKCLFSKVY